MGKLPNALVQKQEVLRQKSINLVIRAIADLNAEGYRIKIKDLMERTGLSRSIFAKSHIRQILVKNGICKPPVNIEFAKTTPTNKATRISNLEKKLLQKDDYIRRLTDEIGKLKDECALLRGRLFLLMQRQSER